jgi:hypothetical protein
MIFHAFNLFANQTKTNTKPNQNQHNTNNPPNLNKHTNKPKQSIIAAYRQAATLAVAKVKEMSVSLEGTDDAEKRSLLTKCAATSLNSKLVSGERDFFADMVVSAVSRLDPASLDLRMVGVKKVTGGGLRDSFLVDGVAFKKTFSYAGFEQQPKSFKGEGWRVGWLFSGIRGFAGSNPLSPASTTNHHHP